MIVDLGLRDGRNRQRRRCDDHRTGRADQRIVADIGAAERQRAERGDRVGADILGAQGPAAGGNGEAVAHDLVAGRQDRARRVGHAVIDARAGQIDHQRGDRDGTAGAHQRIVAGIGTGERIGRKRCNILDTDILGRQRAQAGSGQRDVIAGVDLIGHCQQGAGRIRRAVIDPHAGHHNDGHRRRRDHQRARDRHGVVRGKSIAARDVNSETGKGGTRIGVDVRAGRGPRTAGERHRLAVGRAAGDRQLAGRERGRTVEHLRAGNGQQSRVDDHIAGDIADRIVGCREGSACRGRGGDAVCNRPRVRRSGCRGARTGQRNRTDGLAMDQPAGGVIRRQSRAQNQRSGGRAIGFGLSRRRNRQRSLIDNARHHRDIGDRVVVAAIAVADRARRGQGQAGPGMGRPIAFGEGAGIRRVDGAGDSRRADGGVGAVIGLGVGDRGHRDRLGRDRAHRGHGGDSIIGRVAQRIAGDRQGAAVRAQHVARAIGLGGCQSVARAQRAGCNRRRAGGVGRSVILTRLGHGRDRDRGGCDAVDRIRKAGRELIAIDRLALSVGGGQRQTGDGDRLGRRPGDMLIVVGADASAGRVAERDRIAAIGRRAADLAAILRTVFGRAEVRMH